MVLGVAGKLLEFESCPEFPGGMELNDSGSGENALTGDELSCETGLELPPAGGKLLVAGGRLLLTVGRLLLTGEAKSELLGSWTGVPSNGFELS